MHPPAWMPLAFWATILYLLLSGCQRAPEGDAPEVTRSVSIDDRHGGVHVWIDPATGCEYLLRYDKAITPRYERTPSGGMIRGCR